MVANRGRETAVAADAGALWSGGRGEAGRQRLSRDPVACSGVNATWFEEIAGIRLGVLALMRTYSCQIRLHTKPLRRPQDTLRSQQGAQALYKLLGMLPAAREPVGETRVSE